MLPTQWSLCNLAMCLLVPGMESVINIDVFTLSNPCDGQLQLCF